MAKRIQADLLEIVEFTNTEIANRFTSFGFKKNEAKFKQFSQLSPRIVLESLPTPWAAAEAFRHRLLAGDQDALEEWGALLFLVYFNIAAVQRYDERMLDKLDTDLPKAIQRTPGAPCRRLAPETPLDICLITTSDGRTCLGGAHPSCLVFPAQDRSDWGSHAETLGLNKGRLSFSRLLELRAREPRQRTEFATHLQTIKKGKGEATELATALESLIRLTSDPSSVADKDGLDLDENPYAWIDKRLGGDVLAQSGEKIVDWLVANYPLRVKRPGGGFALLTVAKLDKTLNPWIRSRPWGETFHFDEIRPHGATVAGGGNRAVILREQVVQLPDDTTAFELGDLLLTAHWGLNDRWLEGHRPEDREGKKRSFQRPRSFFTGTAAAILPLRQRFFGALALDDQGPGALACTRTGETDDEWQLTLAMSTGRTFPEAIRWVSSRLESGVISDVLVEMWPPRTSPEWKLYMLRFTGVEPEDTGEWAAFKVDGSTGFGKSPLTVIDASPDTIQVLDGPPRGLAVRRGDVEHGVVLFEHQSVRPAAVAPAVLAVDFGTSNTCLAVRPSEAEDTASVIEFNLGATALWGWISEGIPQDEAEGWFPRSWNRRSPGEFFPTILWHRDSYTPQREMGSHISGVDFLESQKGFLAAIPQIDLRGLRWLDSGWDPPPKWRSAGDLKWGRYDSPGYSPANRTLFLKQLMLLAHAQLFFGTEVKAGYALPPARYKFTYPLAMLDSLAEFHEDCKNLVNEVRKLVYVAEPVDTDIEPISESEAIAASLPRGSGQFGNRTIVLDVGGGTADVCVLRGHKPACMDSVRLAGRRYFEIVHRTVKDKQPGHEAALEYLSLMLHYRDLTSGDPNRMNRARRDPARYVLDRDAFPHAFSLLIRGVSAEEVGIREKLVLGKANPNGEYSTFLVRAMFVHLIAYGLVMAAADILQEAIASQDAGVSPWNWKPRMTISLAGNGWGLLPFGQLDRRTNSAIKSLVRETWATVKQALIDDLAHCRHEACHHDSEIGLLTAAEIEDVSHLGNAKTAVAIGAARSGAGVGSEESLPRYFGLSFYDLILDGKLRLHRPVHWHDRLSVEAFSIGEGRSQRSTFDDVSFPADVIQANSPLHPLQKALVDLMTTGRPNLLEERDYPTWNDRLQAAYREKRIFPVGQAKLTKTPLSFLLESFHADWDLVDRIATNQRVIRKG